MFAGNVEDDKHKQLKNLLEGRPVKDLYGIN